jgi:hypothetical protein
MHLYGEQAKKILKLLNAPNQTAINEATSKAVAPVINRAQGFC